MGNRGNMSCHGDQGGGHKRGLHGILMILCCLLPLLLIIALPALGIKSSAISLLAVLACPLMHVGMMFMMGKSGHGEHHHQSNQISTKNNAEIQDANPVE